MRFLHRVDAKNVDSTNIKDVENTFLWKIKKTLKTLENIDIDVSEIIAKGFTWVSMSTILLFIILYTI